MKLQKEQMDWVKMEYFRVSESSVRLSIRLRT